MLITIEGIDGSGKSTLINAIKTVVNRIQGVGSNIIFSQEPYGTMKKNIETCKDSIKKQSIYSIMSHAEHLEKLIEPKNKNNIIITERFYDSIIAYQAAAQNIDIIKFNEYFNRISVKPDLTVLLTCDIDKAYDRSQLTFIDSKLYLNEVQDNFKILSKLDNKKYITIDTTDIDIEDYIKYSEEILYFLILSKFI